MKTILSQALSVGQQYQVLFDKAQQTLDEVCREYRQTDFCRKKKYKRKYKH